VPVLRLYVTQVRAVSSWFPEKSSGGEKNLHAARAECCCFQGCMAGMRFATAIGALSA
jgi:hypothetical protein